MRVSGRGGRRTRCCPFRRLRILLVGEVFGAFVLWKQNRNISIAEAGLLQPLPQASDLGGARYEAEFDFWKK